MDVISTSFRGGVASCRGTYRTAKRGMLEKVYVAKEYMFDKYDNAVAKVKQKRRGPMILNRGVPVFHASETEGLRYNRGDYECRMPQHGESEGPTR